MAKEILRSVYDNDLGLDDEGGLVIESGIVRSRDGRPIRHPDGVDITSEPARYLTQVFGQDAAGNSGRTLFPNSLPIVASVIGDSIALDSFGNNIFTSFGFLSWAKRFSRGRLAFEPSRVYAVSGAKISDVVNSQLAPAVADASELVFINIGTNSVGSETDAAALAGYATIFDTLLAAGKMLVVFPTRVHGPAYAFTSDQLKTVGRWNRYIKQYSVTHRNVLVVDLDMVVQDFSTGQMRSGFYRDDLHDNPTSAMVQGEYIWNQIERRIGGNETLLTHAGDLYDATLNPNGNRLANGLMAGTGGTVVNGATGQTPDSWRGRRSSGGISVTAAFSKTDHPTLTGLKETTVTLGGTGDGGSIILDQDSSFTIGSTMEIEAECSIANLTNVAGLGIWVYCFDAGFTGPTLSPFAVDGEFGTSGIMQSGVSKRFAVKTPRFVVPSYTAYVSVQLIIWSYWTGGSVSGTVTWGRASARTV